MCPIVSALTFGSSELLLNIEKLSIHQFHPHRSRLPVHSRKLQSVVRTNISENAEISQSVFRHWIQCKALCLMSTYPLWLIIGIAEHIKEENANVDPVDVDIGWVICDETQFEPETHTKTY